MTFEINFLSNQMSIAVFEGILTLMLILSFANSFFRVDYNFPLALAAMYVWRLQKVACDNRRKAR